MQSAVVTPIDRHADADAQSGSASNERGRTDPPSTLFLTPPARTTFRGLLLEGSDCESILCLATLSRGHPPEGAVLLAEAEGDPVAAIGIFDGQTVFDPARSTLAPRMRLRLLRLGLRVVVALRGF